MTKPDCSKCIFAKSVPGNAHIECTNTNAKVTGDEYGRRMGWFIWPWLFDPTWLKSCDGFKKGENNL